MFNIITIEQIEGENGRDIFVHIIFSMQTNMDTITYVTSEISGILIKHTVRATSFWRVPRNTVEKKLKTPWSA